MSTELYDDRRFRLWLCLLFGMSFALFMLTLRPTAVVESVTAITPTESTQESVVPTVILSASTSVASVTPFDEVKLPVISVPTLQDLAVDSDAETRLEAQMVLALVDEEAGADYY